VQSAPENLGTRSADLPARDNFRCLQQCQQQPLSCTTHLWPARIGARSQTIGRVSLPRDLILHPWCSRCVHSAVIISSMHAVLQNAPAPELSLLVSQWVGSEVVGARKSRSVMEINGSQSTLRLVERPTRARQSCCFSCRIALVAPAVRCICRRRM
jgi:hypothetical protein